MPRRCHNRLMVTMLVVTVVASALPASVVRAHDAGDMPSKGSEDARPQAAGASPGPPGPARKSLRWPLVLIGAGLLAGAGGALVMYQESRPVAGPCAPEAGFSHTSCPSPSTGGGAGVGLLLVGGQLALGGVIWLAVSLSAHDRNAPLALGVGPGTLGLRATF